MAAAAVGKSAKAPVERFALVGQESVRAALRVRVWAGEPAHSYLISGPRGVGKFGVAQELAVLLLCDRPTETGSCGECPQCRLSVQFQHPDLHVLFPLPKKKHADEEEEEIVLRISELVRQRLDQLAADPYAETRLPKSRGKDGEDRVSRSEDAIRIGYTRWLVRMANKTPFQARRKVFIVCHADTMNTEAQSAFLKTLEDPPERTHFILITEHEGELKDTVRSRCRRIRLNGLPTSLLIDHLSERGVERALATSVAALSRGSVARARELLSSDLNATQNQIIDFMRTTATGCDPVKLQKLIEEFTSGADAGRGRILDLMIAFWHDVSLYRAYAGHPPVPLAFDAQQDVVDKLVRAFPHALPDRAVSEIERAAAHLERYYSPDYVYYSLAIRLHDAFGPRRALVHPERPHR
ncbi:hypothetical protein HZB60_08790 [candidate division KSB1 bacterium]|nr:hypothetical protein [candidate division KSB1 bacterium]